MPTGDIKPGKPFVFPKGKPLMAPAAPLPNENQILRALATKPVVKPPTKAANKALTKPLKSYL